jgi:hypothetical protein
MSAQKAGISNPKNFETDNSYALHIEKVSFSNAVVILVAAHARAAHLACKRIDPGMESAPVGSALWTTRQRIAAGGLGDSVKGPVMVPSSYTVVLDYDGQKTQQSRSGCWWQKYK